MNNFIKIDDCLYQDIIDNNLNIDDYLLDNVSKIKNSLEYETICDMNRCLIDCESPIEQILSITMNFMGLKHINRYNNFIDLCIKNNREVICKNGEKYRLDFYIIVLYRDEKGNKVKNCYFDIECDDYEFHQRYATIKYLNRPSIIKMYLLENEDNYQGNAVVNYTEYEVPDTRIIEHKHFEYAKSLGQEDTISNILIPSPSKKPISNIKYLLLTLSLRNKSKQNIILKYLIQVFFTFLFQFRKFLSCLVILFLFHLFLLHLL